MSRHERGQQDSSRLHSARQPLPLTIDTPNSLKTVNGQTPNSGPNASLVYSDKGKNVTPKFVNNTEEVLQFVDFAQEQLKKRISEADLRSALERRVSNLKVKQEENNKLQTQLTELEYKASKQRSENDKLKRSIDVYKNQIYQDRLEIERLNRYSSFFETKKWSSPKKRRVEGGGSGRVADGFETSIEREVKAVSRMESNSRERNNFSMRNETPNIHTQKNSGENLNIRMRMTSQPIDPASKTKVIPADMDGLVTSLKREVVGSSDHEDIIRKMGQAIDCFQYYIIEKILNQQQKELPKEDFMSENRVSENCHSRKFDFESLRENTERKDEPRVSVPIRQFKVRNSTNPKSMAKTGDIPGLQFKNNTESKEACRGSSRAQETVIDVYQPNDRLQKPNFHSFQVRDPVNFSFAGQEALSGKITSPEPLEHSSLKFKQIPNFRFLKKGSHALVSTNRERKLHSESEIRTHAFRNGRLVPIGEKVALKTDRRNNGNMTLRQPCEKSFKIDAVQTSLRNELIYDRPAQLVNRLSSKRGQQHPYEQRMAEKSLRFQQNLSNISARFLELKKQGSLSIVRSLQRRIKSPSVEHNLIRSQVSKPMSEEQGSKLQKAGSEGESGLEKHLSVLGNPMVNDNIIGMKSDRRMKKPFKCSSVDY